MKIENISRGLARGEHGVFYAETAGPVSYAAEGHASCFQVEDHSFWFRHRNDCIALMVERYPFKGPMLDIGGGNGYVAQRLIAEGHDVMLLEPGPVGARNARLERGLPHVACATVETAGFIPGSFGAIGLFDVIEHIQHDRSFLEGIAPLLAPGGRIYLSVPCHEWLWSHADIQAGHFRRYTRESMEALLDDSFRLDFFSYFFGPLTVPQFIFRALPYRIGLGGDGGLLSDETQHGSGNGILVRAMNRLLAREARRIGKGESLGSGASALVCATLR